MVQAQPRSNRSGIPRYLGCVCVLFRFRAVIKAKCSESEDGDGHGVMVGIHLEGDALKVFEGEVEDAHPSVGYQVYPQDITC